MSILFVGEEDLLYAVRKAVEQQEQQSEVIHMEPTVRLRELPAKLTAADHTHYIIDLDTFLADSQVLAETFLAVRTASNIPICFLSMEYDPASTIINVLRSAGFRYFALSAELGTLYRELQAFLDGKPYSFGKSASKTEVEIAVKSDPEYHPSVFSHEKTISFIGARSGIGTTTQAVQFTKYLQAQGYHAGYLEAVNQNHMLALSDLFGSAVKQDQSLDCITFEGIRLFTNPLLLEEIHHQEFDVLVFDYGTYSPERLCHFLQHDSKVLVTGSKPWELPAFSHILKQITDKHIYYLFRSTPKSQQPAFLENMGKNKAQTFFCHETRDLFSLNSNDQSMHTALLESLQPQRRPKQRRRLFSGWSRKEKQVQPLQKGTSL